MRTSKMVDMIIEAHRRGYVVRADGKVESPYGRVLSGWETKDGYLALSLRNRADGKPEWVHIHSLAAFQLFGSQALCDNVQVRHLNNKPTDNRLKNIGIGSPHDNRMDLPKGVRVKTAAAGGRTQRKLTTRQAVQLRKDRARGAKYAELMEKYGISKSTVSYIVNNKTYGQVMELEDMPVSKTGTS